MSLEADFPFAEAKLQTRFGLTRGELRELRELHLHEGEHFTRIKKRVCLSQAGIDALETHLGVKNPPPEASGAPEAAPEPVPQPPAAPPAVRLLVWRANFPSTRIITAHKPGEDPENPANIVRVCVRDNRNFRRIGQDGKQMEIQARHLGGDLYELVGRAPRYPGKW